MNFKEILKLVPKFEGTLICIGLAILLIDGIFLGLALPKLYEKIADVQVKQVVEAEKNTIKAGTRVRITETQREGTIMETRTDDGPFEIRLLIDAEKNESDFIEFFRTEFEKIR